jgi:hypothetical protein
MTLEKAREMVALQAQLGGGYNRNSVRLILGEVHRQYGQQAVDALIREFDLASIFGIEPGSDFSRFGR